MPQNCRNQEHNLERKYFSRGVVIKSNILPVKTYKICAPQSHSSQWYNTLCVLQNLFLQHLSKEKKNHNWKTILSGH